MKGSILLANIPGMDKPGEHHSKIAPQ
jgi:hypothetical protein